jgi:uncharacterized protein YjbJ (UPF0337 family)
LAATGTAFLLGLFLMHIRLLEELAMDRQRMEGGLKKATGTIKEKAGQITGDRDLEAEGKVDKGEGHIRSAVGKVKDAAREIVGKK